MLFIDTPTPPVWAARHTLPTAPPLTSDATADVCVVGAGIAGLTTALLLAREKIKVVAVDAAQPGAGESARTTAHLTTAIDDRYYNMVRWHGREGAMLAAQSQGAAIDRIAAFIEELGLVCDYRRLNGYLFADSPDDEARLDEELRASHLAGLRDTDICPWPGGEGPRCLRFPAQAQISPWPYLRGLHDEIVRLGGRVHGDTRVIDIEEGTGVVVHAENGARVRAGAVVVATSSPIDRRFAVHAKVAPHRTYAMALPVPAGAVPRGLFWDTATPGHQARVTASAEADTAWLLVSGEGHKTNQDDEAENHFTRLESWARRRFPAAGEPTHRWSAQVFETIDGLGFFGRHPGGHDNTYIAAGDSGMGIAHGTVAGLIIADLIQGRPSPWSLLYNPGRMNLGAALAFARENFEVARQYLDWGRPHAKDDPDEVAPGTGRVVQRGLRKIALYRDASGTLHERSAVCPHQGCIIAWNDGTHTWDCPCHGSRFEPTGDVLRGPAITPLQPA